MRFKYKEETMKTSITLLFVAMTLSGCATAVRTYTADGKEGYSITCSGLDMNWGTCYEKAGQICGTRGYEVLEKNSDQQSSVAGTQYGLFAKSSFNRNLIIRCK